MRVKLKRGLIVRGTNGGEFEAEAIQYPARKLANGDYEIAFCCDAKGKIETAVVAAAEVDEVPPKVPHA